VEAAEIEAAVTERTKAILICNPNNPTGAALTREDVEAIAQVAISHDLYVIADEIYDRLSYPGPHASMAAAAGARERTVLLNGFSKAYAMTGWRLGYVCATGEVAEAIARVHQYGMLCAPHIAQRAAIEALRCGEPDVREMIADYDRRRRYFVKGLNSIGLDCFDPAGAFYAFPSVHRTGLSSEAFAEALLQEERVVVVPGNAFGAAGEGFVRCCYATAMEQLEEALDRMRRFMERRLAPRPVRAARA
jgi:aminotransferase